MKDYLKEFASVANYNTWKNSDRYIDPNVSYITENGGSVQYNKINSGNNSNNNPYASKYLTLVALENGTFTFGHLDTPDTNYFSYSIDDGETWTPGNSVNVNIGDKVLLKGNITSTEINIWVESEGSGSGSGSGSEGYYITEHIRIDGNHRFNVEGNIMSLMYGDNFIGQTDLTGKNNAFNNLFKDAKLVDASNLILPATTLAPYCYSEMFRGCTSLTTAPELPATTLTEYCYYIMFTGCTSLTTAPELPATTLANYCYSYMFQNCTSLIIAPELPATTLADNCYMSMFQGCTSLTIAPELPATTLANQCYINMFQGCTSLTIAPELTATTLATLCYMSMFQGCTSLTIAPELPATTLADSCYKGMFNGCTSLTTAPELPATTLASNCYKEMFKGCTSLTTAPELPATTLTTECYREMFRNCTSLNYIKCLATDISANGCTMWWVYNVASSGTFIKPASTDWSSKIGTDGIPTGWDNISINDLPIDWTQSSYSIPINSFENPKLVNPYNLPVTYTSSDTTIATIDTNGVVTYVNEGTITLTASFAGNNNYQAKTATCTLIITEYSKSVEYLTIESLQDNNTIGWKTSNTSLLKTISISTDDGTTWTSFESSTAGTALATLNSGDKLLIKGSNTAYGNGSWYYNYFTSTGNFNIEGNIMSLLYGDNFIGQTGSTGYNFIDLFKNCSSLISAENLILPATTLSTYCYSEMFRGCTSLTTAPELPATTLKPSCYASMFQGCTSLTTAPELPATTLANNCYQNMFYGCTSLTTAPKLPATTLADECYGNMFKGCTSLTTAPELPATTLVNKCYLNMFYNCTSLNYIKCLATDISATNCIAVWVSGVATTGTFVKNASMKSWSTGTTGIPSGWTVQDAA